VTDSVVQIREVGAQGSYLSQNSIVQHFGLGTRNTVDTIEVTWPSGLQQVLTNVTANQLLHITEGDSGSSGGSGGSGGRSEGSDR
jgi:hypothetical protein